MPGLTQPQCMAKSHVGYRVRLRRGLRRDGCRPREPATMGPGSGGNTGVGGLEIRPLTNGCVPLHLTRRFSNTSNWFFQLG